MGYFRTVQGLRRIALLACFIGSVAIGSVGARADEGNCNCTTEGQCADAACCFVNSACMASGKTCNVMGSAPNKTCSAGTGCSYTGPCCAPGGEGCYEG